MCVIEQIMHQKVEILVIAQAVSMKVYGVPPTRT